MINYIIQVMLFQILFLAVYDLALSKETFFTKNRWYLLVTAIGSFLIPLIKLPGFKQAVPKEISIVLPEIVLSPQSFIEQTSVYQSFNYGSLIFWAGLVFFSFIFSIRLYKLIRLIFKNSVKRIEDYYLITIPNSKKAFSFFNYVFIGAHIDEEEKDKIISHELIHSRQKHSLDLLLFEGLKIVMWFNPLLYVYQKRISTVHEYISDDIVIKSIEKKQYINNLVNQLFDVEQISFVNQFYKSSLMKKRIMMMTKQKSKQIKQAKYLLLIPVLLCMLFYISCSDESTINNTSELGSKTTTYYNVDGIDKSLEKVFEEYRKNSREGYQEPPKTYLDKYSDRVAPTFGNLIQKEDLNSKETLEFEEFLKSHEYNGYAFWSNVSLYELNNGRKMIAVVWDFSMDEVKKQTTEKDMSFSTLDQIPTFPGCEENDRKCFSQKMQEHFSKNFDAKLPKQLKMSSGKKRITVQFKIDKEGNVVGVKTNAPHPKLREEAEQIISNLPKMKPGKHQGKTVGVKYTLPVRIDVE